MNVILILCDTLRRDHCGGYHDGRSLHQVWSAQQPDWRVPTPNLDRLAAEGTVFDACWCGSTPCMPARRDLYTGRYEFLERGWGPLEEDDRDLPRQVSGPPNQSVARMRQQGLPVSALITDHFHLWEQGAGNYHMGYTGFEFIRGNEADAWHTDPIAFTCPPGDRLGKNERHWRNVHLRRQADPSFRGFADEVFGTAADWVRRNRTHENFYLHLDCFPPHEPFDPPEDVLKQFWPAGYDVPFEWASAAPYAPIAGCLTPDQVRFAQARYAANVVTVDRALGQLWAALDETSLWDDTLVILTTDHGTFNGDHGRTGKLQTHQFDALAHTPLLVRHPQHGHGERRAQLVQLVDLYPTVLAAVGRPLPDLPPERPLHGVNLLPVLADAAASTREVALTGMFGRSVTMTDGRWVLHQKPGPANQPLLWHGYHLARFIGYPLGPFADGVRPVDPRYRCDIAEPTWLSDRASDPNELTNLAAREPAQLRAMQLRLRQALADLRAPPEQAERLGLDRL